MSFFEYWDMVPVRLAFLAGYVACGIVVMLIVGSIKEMDEERAAEKEGRDHVL